MPTSPIKKKILVIAYNVSNVVWSIRGSRNDKIRIKNK
jgi:hypothetical protein